MRYAVQLLPVSAADRALQGQIDLRCSSMSWTLANQSPSFLRYQEMIGPSHPSVIDQQWLSKMAQ